MTPGPRLTLAKYSGAGNDFLVVDERDEPGWDAGGAAVRALCRRGASIGADGLVFVSRSELCPGAVARMRLWNADGSTAEFSGNAARCVLRHLAERGEINGEACLQTDIGLVRGRVQGTTVSVQVPGVARVWPQRRIRVEGRDLQGTYVHVGVPFFVLLHEDPDDLPVRFLGRAIRRHPDLRPAGANVDFVRLDDEQNLYFRVYERGVEAETLSSGTGSIAAALAAAALERVVSPVACHAKGGTLTVRFRPTAGQAAAPGDETTAGGDGRTGDGPGGVGTGRAAGDDAGDDPGGVRAGEDGEDARADDDLPRVAEGEPGRFAEITLEGETRCLFRGVALADALRP